MSSARTPPPDLRGVPEPSLLYAFDGDDWQYYVPGRNPSDLEQIDELDSLMWEPVWMRPVTVAQLDEYERGDLEPLTRDDKGRFKSAYAWLVCSESDPAARPWMGVRYKNCSCDGNPSGGACSYPDCQLPLRHFVIHSWHDGGSVIGALCSCGREGTLSEIREHILLREQESNE